MKVFKIPEYDCEFVFLVWSIFILFNYGALLIGTFIRYMLDILDEVILFQLKYLSYSFSPVSDPQQSVWVLDLVHEGYCDSMNAFSLLSGLGWVLQIILQFNHAFLLLHLIMDFFIQCHFHFCVRFKIFEFPFFPLRLTLLCWFFPFSLWFSFF